MFSELDEAMMQRALQLADTAATLGEVPVGAVLVLENEIIGEGFNTPITEKDPSAHAEMVALRNGAKKIGNYRILNATLYVTLEPCLMCAGALVHSRIKRLVFGAADPKVGVITSRSSILNESFLNHRIDYAGGLLAEICGEKLSHFFKLRRA